MAILNKIKLNLIQSLIGLGLFFLLIFVKSLLFPESIGVFSAVVYVTYLVIAVLFIMYIRSRYAKEQLLPKFGLLNLLKKGGGFLLSALIFLSLFYGMDYLRSGPSQLPKIKEALSLVTILTVFIQVFMEEIIFRYYMAVTLTRQKSDTYIYLFTSSIAFAVLHAFTYNYYVLFHIFLSGIAFGMLYILTKNIGVPIGLHFANNYYLEINTDSVEELYAPGSFTELFKDNQDITFLIALVYLWWIFRYHVFVKK